MKTLNRLYVGDNLDVLPRYVTPQSIDFAYIDPPFVSEDAFRVVAPDTDGAYFSFLRDRLSMVRNALSHTGSVAVHADAASSPHARRALDEVFGREAFLNEVVWVYGRSGGSGGGSHLTRQHELLYWYAKVRGQHKYRAIYAADAGHTTKPVVKKPPLGDVWTISPNRRGAVTSLAQKPAELMRRLIEMTTDPDDTVLDPFLGSGTTAIAAQELGRRWIGIEISPAAVGIARSRVRERFGNEASSLYSVVGEPASEAAARELADMRPFDYMRWVVGLLGARLRGVGAADRGADALLTLGDRNDQGRFDLAAIEVKRGPVGRHDIAQLNSYLALESAVVGILVTLEAPSPEVVDLARQMGQWRSPDGQTYPRLQVVTVEQLLEGTAPSLPRVVWDREEPR